MDYLFIIIGFICILAGIAGSILPGLPGPPLSYLGILLLHWTRFAQFSSKMLVTWAVIVLIVAILDYVVPIWGTKKYGGTRAGVRGSIIGLIVGIFFLPLGPFGLIGILGGPFLGAWIGEIYAGQEQKKALRAAYGSFVGFLAGTLMKIAVSLVLAFYFFKIIIQALL
jgi:uncharacterized protein YqgC (DUF456 family)